ncbi:MAG TPA: class I SAM-dependent methyltransferase [Mycobacterium sp.]|nr:class I SAM-dependent methyltransferase [Mycobacterium sp.]
MLAKKAMFRAMYRLGFTPWDGHPLAKGLRYLVEGNGRPPLPAGSALDLGCGTGDNSIYLAQHGWRVTGVDFVPQALHEAREKAAAGNASITFVHADVTQLASTGIEHGFTLVVDSGCIHGMSDRDRAAYAREITTVTAPDARLLIVAFTPGELFGVRGIDEGEITRLFSPNWSLVSVGDEPEYRPTDRDHPVRHYLLART